MQTEFGYLFTQPRSLRFALCLVCCFGLSILTTPVWGNEVNDDEGWRFQVSAFIWLLNMEGEVEAQGQKTDVDVNIFDIMDDADSVFGFPLRVDARNGPWVFFVEPQYGLIKVKENDPVKVDVTSQFLILEFGGSYRIAEGQAGSAGRKWWFEPIIGARYTYLDLELDAGSQGSFEDNEGWIDPFVGFRGVYPLGERWTIGLRGDIGGFGVGSEFTWHAIGYVTYGLATNWEIGAGYRALYQRYEFGSGSDQGEWDILTHGPIFGATYKF